MNLVNNSRILGMPSWIKALILAFISFIVLFVLGYPLGETVGYLVYTVIIIAGSYWICKKNPRSVWYVPILANVFGIVAAIGEENFYWISSLMIILCGGFILSILASILGSRIGARHR
ncbi:MAG: hypothetical protein HKN68_15350 [Saprospiraceae bacterium]|nr:hypothetical protein [Saprospiraceae bacterium]